MKTYYRVPQERAGIAEAQLEKSNAPWAFASMGLCLHGPLPRRQRPRRGPSFASQQEADSYCYHMAQRLRLPPAGANTCAFLASDWAEPGSTNGCAEAWGLSTTPWATLKCGQGEGLLGQQGPLEVGPAPTWSRGTQED